MNLRWFNLTADSDVMLSVAFLVVKLLHYFCVSPITPRWNATTIFAVASDKQILTAQSIRTFKYVRSIQWRKSCVVVFHLHNASRQIVMVEL